MGIEDEIELEKGIKYFINKNTFSYMPILQIVQAFMKLPLIAYSDKVGIETPFKRETTLVFQLHVDGNYPIKMLKSRVSIVLVKMIRDTFQLIDQFL